MKILVCYNESNLSQKVTEVAKAHAKAFNAHIIVVNSMRGGRSVPKKEFERIEDMLENVRCVLEKDGISCESQLLVHGLGPGEDLIKCANENKVDLIIIGIEKKSKVGKLLFGSTAQFVILEAACPVLSIT